MKQEIQFTPIKADAKQTIQCRLTSCKLPSFAGENCLVAAFSGVIDDVGSHETGYGYMHAMIGDGFAACNPATLILDLRDLRYSSGEQMSRIVDQRIITKVVASNLNRAGLERLYSAVLFLAPESEMFDSVENALNACDTSYRQFLRDGRKKIIAADF